jgi:hypothetical protein
LRAVIPDKIMFQEPKSLLLRSSQKLGRIRVEKIGLSEILVSFRNPSPVNLN